MAAATDPRVLHMLPFLGMGGGAPRAMLTLVSELQRRRPTWVFSLLDDELAAEARKVGAEVICGFRDRWPDSAPRRWAGTALALRRTIRQHQINVLHCHSAPGNRYCYPASRLTGVPLVTHQRDTYKKDHFHRWVARTDHIIAISEWAKVNLPERLRQKTTVVYDAVAIPAEERLDARNSSHKLVVGMAGRCVPEKGHDLLIRASLALLERHDFSVEIWGWSEEGAPGEFARILRSEVRDSGRSDAFHFEGYRLDMENFYQRVDIVVVPSRVKEGFGLMAAEGLAWRKSVAAASHGGLVEIVEDGRTGLHFAPGDAESLRSALERLLTDGELRSRLAGAGRAAAVARFSPAVHADNVERVYDLLLSRERARA